MFYIKGVILGVFLAVLPLQVLFASHYYSLRRVRTNILTPLRRDSEGFRGERQRYLAHSETGILPGESLSDTLRGKAYSYHWPLDMRDPVLHITAFFGGLQYPDPSYPMIHKGIDIQTAPGIEVRSVEGGVLALVDTEYQMFENLVDIYIYSESSDILWLYAHMERSSLPKEFFDNSNWWKLKIGEREKIGAVGRWPAVPALDNSVKVPPDVSAVYGRSYNHLHLEAIFLPEGTDNSGSIINLNRFSRINPLLLLERLYSF